MSDRDEYKDEFDELDSDYGDAEVPITAGFDLGDTLPESTLTELTTKQLHNLIHEGYIDLNPPYQRDPVWGRDKQSALIESLYKNYYVPPIVFSVQDAEDPEPPMRVCMDGKQRLTSILSFFDGQIPYKNAETRKSFYYTLPASHTKKQLEVPEHFKHIFDSKKIRCVEFRGITAEAERDIFRRVQLGVTLTSAEKLASIKTPYTEWLQELELKHINHERDGLLRHINWSTARGKALECLAQLVYCYEKLPARSMPSSHKLHSWLSREDSPSLKVRKDIDEVLNSFWVIASSAKLNDAFKTISAQVAPVEFVYIGVLLAILHGSSKETKATETLQLRNFLRGRHKDVRANSVVIASCWEFIEAAAKRTGGGDSSFKVESEKKKRKRASTAVEHKPTPITALGIPPKTKAKTTHQPNKPTKAVS